MDDPTDRAMRGAIGHAPCVFEKALLASASICAYARFRTLGERQLATCNLPAARIDCAAFAGSIRERSAFALRLRPAGKQLPHAVGMKLQCGGLAGLAAALGATDTDVHRLLVAARGRWGSLFDLPWSDIVAAVANWQIRRRHRGRKKA
jgi:hypothetical protein